MKLPDFFIESLQLRLKDEAALSEATVTDIVSGLQSGSPLKWDILLTKEIAPVPKDETDH